MLQRIKQYSTFMPAYRQVLRRAREIDSFDVTQRRSCRWPIRKHRGGRQMDKLQAIDFGS